MYFQLWFGVIIRPLLNCIAHIYLLPSHIILALTGALPESIGNWESVIDVDMSENSFSSDSGLPTTIGNWKLIEKLQFFNSGEFLSSIFILRFVLLLNIINISFSHLLEGIGGVLPTEIGQLVKLEVLDLSKNKKEGVEGSLGISGGIPTEIGNLVELKILVLFENALSGE